MKFSVIVPVYNRENTIRRCLDSLLDQSYRDYEVLIIDDGSTDETWVVLKKYSTENDNIRILHQSNSGVSSARNVGLRNALGDYVIFVDSDDWVAQGYLEYLASVLVSEKVDGIILDYYVDSPGKKPARANSTISIPSDIQASEYRNFFLSGDIKNCMWDKVIRRDIFLQGNICFPENISICEDAVVAASIGNYIRTIKVTGNAFLYYFQNEGSLSRKITTTSAVAQIFTALDLMEKIFLESRSDISKINEMKLRQLFYYIVTLEVCSSEERDNILKSFYEVVDSLSLHGCRSRHSKMYFIFSKLSKVPIIRRILFSGYNLFRNRANC